MKKEKKLKKEVKKINTKLIVGLIVILVVVLIGLLLIPNKKKVTVCSNNVNQSESGYVVKTDYKITSIRDVVKTVEITDRITSSNNTILDYLEKKYKDIYTEQNKKYGGYTISTEKKGKTVKVKVKIDYTKIKLSELAKDDPFIAEKIKNNKLSLEDAKTMYINLGAVCNNKQKKE